VRTLADGCGRLRTVANGCERLRSWTPRRANAPSNSKYSRFVSSCLGTLGCEFCGPGVSWVCFACSFVSPVGLFWVHLPGLFLFRLSSLWIWSQSFLHGLEPWHDNVVQFRWENLVCLNKSFDGFLVRLKWNSEKANNLNTFVFLHPK
jgi:hypothetical protein